MQQIFEKGDVVQLASGGPAMTVGARTIKANTDASAVIITYTCQWFDADLLREGIFNEDSITCIEVQAKPKKP